jgi:2,4-dienoyl-CoA reductase-like NADH-dependent reductase (Old Yellow Enzyme family)
MTAAGQPDPSPPDPFAPTRLGPVELRNHVIKAATFEGMSRKNVVSDSLVEFHRRMAAGGVAMTTVSYVAVSRDAMGAPGEIFVHDAAGEGLAHIASVVHSEGARIAAQLGHAGAVGVVPGKRVVGPSRTRTLMGTRVEAISKDGIDEVVAHFAAGGRLLSEAGFDSVELHFGHHYLISAFMSPKWNKRKDEYGGSIENRSLLARRILQAVRDAIGNKMAVTAKMNMTDGIRGGLQIEESLKFAKLFEGEGVLDAIELTGGGSQVNQMYMFRGDAPRKEMEAILPTPQRIGFKLFGRVLFKEYPFEEAYFLPMARRFRESLSVPLVLLGGINTVQSIHQAMADGFELVAMGRALLRDPDLVNKMRDGTATEGNCIHCNKCMVSIYTGTRCVIDHPKPFKLA